METERLTSLAIFKYSFSCGAGLIAQAVEEAGKKSGVEPLLVEKVKKREIRKFTRSLVLSFQSNLEAVSEACNFFNERVIPELDNNEWGKMID